MCGLKEVVIHKYEVNLRQHKKFPQVRAWDKKRITGCKKWRSREEKHKSPHEFHLNYTAKEINVSVW